MKKILHYKILRKFLLTMKISIALCLICVMSFASGTYSQDHKMSLNLTGVTVKELLKTIENQSEFSIFYKDDNINASKVFDVNCKNCKVSDILNSAFAGTKLTYRIIDRIIVVSDAKQFASPIKGKVVDKETGEALPGVNVMEKGTTNGTITDADGSFTLDVADPSTAVLIFSFIGYESQEVAVNGQSTVDVNLSTKASDINEVVVIGYGTQKKSLLTGAITSLSAKDMEGLSVSRAEQALQGKVSGLSVVPTSGSPGAGMRMRVRGTGSNGKSDPLYIVDGVKTPDINYLAPEDISNMEILKDAASSAIYGAEGANGVVIITTKSGKKDRGQIEYNFEYGTQKVGDYMKLMNADQYATYMSEGKFLTNINAADWAGKEGTNWYDLIFEKAPMQKHHLSFTGGTEKTSYMASLSYLDQDGIVGGSQANFKRYTGRLNVEHKLNSWLTTGLKLTYSNTRRAAITENSELDGALSNASNIDPLTQPFFDGALPSYLDEAVKNNGIGIFRKNSEGKYYAISQYVQGENLNPLLRLAISKGNTVGDKIQGSYYVDIHPLKGLTITSRVAVDYNSSLQKTWTPTYYYSSERNATSSSLVVNSNTQRSVQLENYISYDLTSNIHHINVVAGNSIERLVYSNTNTTGKGALLVESDDYADPDFTNTRDASWSGRSYDERMLSYFLRASYDLASKYMFQATIRTDGASTSMLADNKNWGKFPSFSLGWVMSEESFWPKDVISYAKLRGSWGQNGSLANLRSTWNGGAGPYANLSPFLYLGGITTAGIRYPLPSGAYATGAEPLSLKNADLTWETSQQTDIGLDLQAMGGAITFSADYYIKKTKDLLALYDAPAIAGNNPAFLNCGDVENKGLEFAIGYHGNAGKFTYNVNTNFSTLKNEVTKLDATVPLIAGANIQPSWTGCTAMEVGQPLWYFRGYKTSGIDPNTGDIIFTDVNKDGKISDADITKIGNPHPKFMYGMNISLAWNGFDFNIFGQGVSGNDILMGSLRSDRGTSNKPEFFYTDRWTASNHNASMPRADKDLANMDKFYMSDLLVKSGAYFRIKQIQLGYTLPQSLIGKIKLTKVRVFVSLDDYFTFTKYPGMDPEVGADSDAAIGIDRGVYPTPRKVLFGISLGL